MVNLIYTICNFKKEKGRGKEIKMRNGTTLHLFSTFISYKGKIIMLIPNVICLRRTRGARLTHERKLEMSVRRHRDLDRAWCTAVVI